MRENSKVLLRITLPRHLFRREKYQKFKRHFNLNILALAVKLSVEVMAYFTSHATTLCLPAHSCQHLTEKINKQNRGLINCANIYTLQ